MLLNPYTSWAYFGEGLIQKYMNRKVGVKCGWAIMWLKTYELYKMDKF